MNDNSKEMRQLYDQWLSGKVTKALFCRQHKIGYSTFHYWAKKFRKIDSLSPPSPQDNGFSRISIEGTGATGQSVQPSTVVTYPSGLRLEFFSPVEAWYLKKLLS